MYKPVIIIVSLILFSLLWTCENTELEMNGNAAIAASEKECLPDANCAGCPEAYGKVTDMPLKQDAGSADTHRITFVELGSVKCVPCKMMQPVMESIQRKYGEQIQVVFYDVWQADQRHYANEYKIRVIPTQVFLDEDGTEIFRHEGFFPESEIDRFLQNEGLTPEEEG